MYRSHLDLVPGVRRERKTDGDTDCVPTKHDLSLAVWPRAGMRSQACPLVCSGVLTGLSVCRGALIVLSDHGGVLKACPFPGEYQRACLQGRANTLAYLHGSFNGPVRLFPGGVLMDLSACRGALKKILSVSRGGGVNRPVRLFPREC